MACSQPHYHGGVSPTSVGLAKSLAWAHRHLLVQEGWIPACRAGAHLLCGEA